jgi:hypothetical protein
MAEKTFSSFSVAPITGYVDGGGEFKAQIAVISSQSLVNILLQTKD